MTVRTRPPRTSTPGARARSAPVAVVVALVLLLAGAVPGSPADVAEAAAPVADGDYATEHFGDPWDYSNPEDLLLDGGGPTLNLDRVEIAGGMLRLDVSRAAYFSPVWGGYTGALKMGREGTVADNAIDAGRYRQLSFRAYASRDVVSGVMWFDCPGGGVAASCQGGQQFVLRAGWHTYDLRLVNSIDGLPRAWSGSLTGLRVALSPSASTTVELDWMRLRADPSPVAPPLGPLPVVDAPDAIGQTDWATAVAGNPWDLDSAADVASLGNATAVSYAGGVLSATSTSNDPFVWLNLHGRTIDSAAYHLLTVRYSYDGAFDLRDAPGGGTNGRVMWRAAPYGDAILQTDDYVTYSDVRSYTYDMSTPGLNEPEAGHQHPFTAGPLTGLRWDPHEDRGPRRWRLEDVTLRTPWRAHQGFAVRWHDDAWVAGSTTALYYARTATYGSCTGTLVAQGLAQRPGSNSYPWVTAGVPAGRYRVCVQTTAPGGATTAAWSSGPVVVGASGRTVVPSAPTRLSAQAGEGRAAVQWAAPAAGDSAVVGYQVQTSPGGALTLVGPDQTGATLRGLTDGAEVSFRVRALNDAGWGPWSSPSAPVTPRSGGQPGSTYHPVAPVRVLDTRDGTGGVPVAPLGARASLTLPVAGREGVPADATAVVLNVTATRVVGGGYVSVYPAGSPAGPSSSNLNTSTGVTRPNLVTVPLGEGGGVTVYNDAGSTDLVADLQGWYSADATGATYHPLAPARLMDRTPLAPRDSTTLQVTGRAGIPETAAAVVLNVTAAEVRGGGYVSVFPTGYAGGPRTSNLNTRPGEATPNLVTTAVGSGGRVTLYNDAGSANLIADVQGWYGGGGGAVLHPVPPWRVVDTRTGLGAPARRLGPGERLVVRLADVPGTVLPSTGMVAAVLNVTATGGTAPDSYLSVTPDGSSAVSNLNFRAGQTVPNLVVATLDARGDVVVYNNLGSTDVVVDVAGWLG